MRRTAMMSVHGIRTHGKWQKIFADHVSARGHRSISIDYGYFSFRQFISGSARRRRVDYFRDQYFERFAKLEALSPKRRRMRPSIVAHSLGSYIVGYAMQKYSDIRFNRVILCGSILPRDFDWSEILGRNQVWQVRNESGLRDIWAQIARLAVSDAGSSGVDGFSFASSSLIQETFRFHAHSDYFSPAHLDNFWLPFLERPSLDLEILHGSQIASLDRFERVLNRCHEIDLQCYAQIPDFVTVDLPRGLSLTWIKVNPDIYTMLVDSSDRVIGYLNAIPLRDEAFAKVLSGHELDPDVRAGDIVPYQRGGPLKVYLMSIAVDPGARNFGQGLQDQPFERLLYGYLRRLDELARDYGARVAEIAAVGWTAEGEKLCELLGMTKVGVDKLGKSIYHARLDAAFAARPNAFQRVRTLAAKGAALV